MHAASRMIAPEGVAAIELFDLVVSGPLRRVEATADGAWIVTPVVGQPLILTGPAEVAAYVDRANHSTGPAALSAAPHPALPAAYAQPAASEDSAGCGCVATSPALPAEYGGDLMEARAVAAALAEYGIPAARRSAAFDEVAQAAVVRVATAHGLYVMAVPPRGQRYTITHNGHRAGQLSARRVPANPDSHVAALLAAHLRDRGEL